MAWSAERTITTTNGNTYDFWAIDNDVNGNPRYLVHFLQLGLKSFNGTKETRAVGLKVYKGKMFGGGFVFTSYSLEQSAKWFEDKGLCKNPITNAAK